MDFHQHAITIHIPIGSMGLIYLPTWKPWKSTKCRQIHRNVPYMDPMGYITLTKNQRNDAFAETSPIKVPHTIETTRTKAPSSPPLDWWHKLCQKRIGSHAHGLVLNPPFVSYSSVETICCSYYSKARHAAKNCSLIIIQLLNEWKTYMLWTNWSSFWAWINEGH